MTFKLNAVKRRVTGTFQKVDGTPSEGKIVIRLSEPVLGRQENTVYSRQPVEIELDETGTFETDLAVTSPGLTTSERDELTTIQQQIAAEAEEMVEVQERINAYLLKIYENQTITQADVLDNRNDLARKKELQDSASELKKQELVFVNKQKELDKAAVLMRIECHFKNPKDNSKVFLIIPDGDTEIDIADLPRQ